jgi:outer membrane protein assembly factor BamB
MDDGIFGVLGDAIQRLDLHTKKPLWRCRVEFDGKDALGRLLSPPAVTAERLYVTSSLGDLFVLDRKTGKELWSLNVGAPILSQPAIAGGNVYLGTSDGTLYSFEADDPDSAGWPMWGGGPGHNGACEN